MDVILTRQGTTSRWSLPKQNFLSGSSRGPLWTLSQCPSGALYLILLKSDSNDFGSNATMTRLATINTKDFFPKKFVFLVELRQIPTPCFLGLFQEFKCRSLRREIVSAALGVRLTCSTHGRDPNSTGYDVQMVITQAKFFVRVEPGPTLDTVAVSVRSLIPYPVEVRFKRFWLERNHDSSGYDKHEGLFPKKIHFPCRIEANSNPLFFRPFSRIQMSQSSSGDSICCFRSTIDVFDTWT